MTVEALAVLLVVAAYFVGSIPFGLLIGKAHGVDVRQVGSGNIGATNVGRALGPRWWFVVFLLDGLKGALPVVLFVYLFRDQMQQESLTALFTWLWLLTGVAAVVGHNYPIYLGFKGGKGVSTSLGVVLAVYPVFTFPALASFALYILIVVVLRISSIGSILAAISFPVFFLLMTFFGGQTTNNKWPYTVVGVLLTAMLVWRHKDNIKRMLHKNELRMGRSSLDANTGPTHTDSAQKSTNPL